MTILPPQPHTWTVVTYPEEALRKIIREELDARQPTGDQCTATFREASRVPLDCIRHRGHRGSHVAVKNPAVFPPDFQTW